MRALTIGLLYGRFGHLVCLGSRDKPIIYRLDLLEEVTSSTQFFVKPEKLNLKNGVMIALEFITETKELEF